MRKPTTTSSGGHQAAILPILGELQETLPEPSEGHNVAQSYDQLPAIISANYSASPSQYCDKWTWNSSSIHKVQYNKHIQAWMDYYPEFYNWVRTCVMLHSDNGLDETRCSIPDQWRGEIGQSITIVTANYIPVRQGVVHETKAGVYHVMN